MSSPGFVYLPSRLDEVENLEKYTPGGYHLVEIGQMYDNNRYKVLHKLGFGGFSTIWLCHDRHQECYIALKILCAQASDSHDLLLAVKSILDGGRHSHLFVTELRRFHVTEPNGRHLCQVLPLMGPSLSALSGHRYRLRPTGCKMLVQEAANILAYLHANNLCHGDFTPSNLLLALSGSLVHLSEDGIYSLLGRPQTDKVNRYGSQAGPGPLAPPYVVEPADLVRFGPQFLSHTLCIADFDEMFGSTASPDLPLNPGYNLGTPLVYRAPEVFFDGLPGQASDIWALGCTLFRIRAGINLLDSWHHGLASNVIGDIFDTVGKPPAKWREVEFRNDWPSGSPQAQALLDRGKDKAYTLRFDEEEDQQDGDADGDEEDLRGKVYKIWDEPGNKDSAAAAATKPDLFWNVPEDVLNWGNVQNGFPHIPEEEAKDLLDLLQRMFEYQTEDRIKAADVLEHRWLRGG